MKGINSKSLSKRLRRRAEILLDENIHKASQLSPADVQKFVRELRVRQIELEMQRDQLRHDQLNLAAARDRFSILYDFAPVGYLTLNDLGVVREANLSVAAMLGVL